MRVDLVALIPAYNEETVIAQTIQSVLDAGMSRDRIIVINDASTDRTAEIARSLGVVVIDNKVNLRKAGGVTNTLRILFSDPRYKDLTNVSCLDADTLIDKKYFYFVRKRLAEDFKEIEALAKKGITKEPISILCGRAKSLPYNWLTAFRANEYWISYAIYKPGQAKVGTTTVAPGCASTYSVAALKYVVWSHDTVVEDMDATIQVALAGGRIEYEKNAVVYTQDPRTVRDYIGQLGKRWYPGSWQVMRKHNLLLPTGRWKYLGPISCIALLLYLAATHSPYLSWVFGSMAVTSYVVSYVLWQAERLHSFLFPKHTWRLWYARVRLRWYCRAMNSDPFMYTGALLYAIFAHPKLLPWMFVMMYGSSIVFSVLASIKERRFDILKYSFIFPFISFLNLILFVGTIGNFFGLKNSAWFSPQRYEPKKELVKKEAV